MRGLQGKSEFTNYLTAVQRQTLERIAEIEQEDADRCESCGGEDCICCEYYQDRQKWAAPEELFSREYGDPMWDDYFMGRARYDDDEGNMVLLKEGPENSSDWYGWIEEILEDYLSSDDWWYIR